MLYSPAKGDFFLVIRMILHFLVLIVILFILHQSNILSMLLWKEDRSSRVLITLYILLSTAYNAIELSLLITPGKS